MTGQPRGRDEEDEKKKTGGIYARVSAQKQAKAGNLVRQVERLHKYAWDHQLTVVDVVTDIGSGMSETRKGLTKLFKYTQEQKMAYLLIEFRERLARYG